VGLNEERGHRVIFRVNLSQHSRKGSIAMTAPHIINPAGLLDQALSDASPDLMRHLLSTVINSLLSAEADAVSTRRMDKRQPLGEGLEEADRLGDRLQGPGEVGLHFYASHPFAHSDMARLGR
jgi:hypothetical protein